jgi:hypothetical protein
MYERNSPPPRAKVLWQILATLIKPITFLAPADFKLIWLSNFLALSQPNKGRSPSNGKLSDFSFYIDSQISVHRKFKK